MSKIYKEVSSNPDFAAIEKEILEFWQKNDCFKKSVEMRPNQINQESNQFVFYDGPPFANGLPHYGHLLTGFIKDTYARYQTNKGKKVERRFGWDCHGLPVEMSSEKELSVSGRANIIKFGVDKFNQHCASSVMKYTSKWQEYVNRQARWVDFENDYKTMDITFMESVLWAFKQLYNKGYVYESMRVMPYSWACETPLSNFETHLDNSYREKADKAVVVAFDINEKLKIAEEEFSNIRIAAWTTTPWTLPSNLALAVNPEMLYLAYKNNDHVLILANFSTTTYANELKNYQLIGEVLGSQLVGLTYKPLFDYFANHENAFKILSADFVVAGSGTGVVHIAPGFGEDDQNLCNLNNISLVCPVDSCGKFTKEIKDFEGLQVFEANDKIIIKLKEQGNWLKTEQYLHNYPHCWRTDTPLIYKAVSSWYVKVTEFKDRMVELNQKINWIPGHVKDGLFGKWLENARDWSISRNRFWGTPIPIWKSDNPAYPRIDVYGSIAELEGDFKVKITDLHKHNLDNLVRPNPDDPTGESMMRRVEDVFDCWFESGSMPYGQFHYPFENKEWFEKNFPADFIVEYAAQTRGWFYTLMVLSTALFDRPPFLNCICHGVILDSSGQKLSKRLNNYADPFELFNKYGADALRFTMLSSNVVKGQELLIDKEGVMVKDCLRLHIKPIWNSYHFFVLYANTDKILAKEIVKSDSSLDNYILSKLKIAVSNIDDYLSNYNTQHAYNEISNFFEILNNWYIRRSRLRFWRSERDQDKIDAYNTLFTCLINMSKASSSLIPLISEAIFLGLTGGDKSVHLEDYPQLNEVDIDQDLINKIDLVRDICSNVLFIRNQSNVRIRQPLNSLTIIFSENNMIDQISPFSELIKEELNVKNIIFADNLNFYGKLKLSLNFPILGKRLPAKMKDFINAMKNDDWLYENNQLSICSEILLEEEYKIFLQPHDSKNNIVSLANNIGMVELDLSIDEDLYLEGIARDLVRLVQQARKDANYDISDRIHLMIVSDNINVASSLERFRNYIEEQTLSNITLDKIDGFSTLQAIEECDIKITISKMI